MIVAIGILIFPNLLYISEVEATMNTTSDEQVTEIEKNHRDDLSGSTIDTILQPGVPQNLVWASTWDEFRTAWNNTATTRIIIQNGISLNGTTSLTRRTNNIELILSDVIIGRSLPLGGSANISIIGQFNGANYTGSDGPMIDHNGFGTVVFDFGGSIHDMVNRSLVSIPNGRLEIRPTQTMLWIARHTVSATPLLEAAHIRIVDTGFRNFNIVIGHINDGRGPVFRANTIQFETAERVTLYRDQANNRISRSWNTLAFTIPQAGAPISYQADPDDFPAVYQEMFGNMSQNISLITLGRNSSWTPPPVAQGTVHIRHVDTAGKEFVREELVGDVGSSYYTNPRTIEGFRLVETPSNASGIFTTEPITVTYIYEEISEGLVRVNHVDEAGSELAEPEELIGKIGETYKAIYKDDIKNHQIKIVPENASGQFTEDAIDVTFVYELKESKLYIEFMNEMNEVMPEYTLTLNRKINDHVDLGAEQAVVDRLQSFVEAGYEIIARPDNERSILLSEPEMTVRYQLAGTLRLTSAPQILDFGTVIYNAKTQRVEKPTFDDEAQPLQVTDTRAGSQSGWTMTAKLVEPLRNERDQELVGALRYVFEGVETPFDQHAQLIHRQMEAQHRLNISDSWGDTQGSDGIKFQIDARDSVHTGTYQGAIRWTIMAGQP